MKFTGQNISFARSSIFGKTSSTGLVVGEDIIAEIINSVVEFVLLRFSATYEIEFDKIEDEFDLQKGEFAIYEEANSILQ